MQPLPHSYSVVASGQSSGEVDTRHGQAPALAVMPPPQFGGPEGFWSPEDLLLAAVADCFVLSFRAVSRAAKLEWQAIEVVADGILDRQDRLTKFTQITNRVRIVLQNPGEQERAEKLLHKAEQTCLVSNTLNISCGLLIEYVDAL